MQHTKILTLIDQTASIAHAIFLEEFGEPMNSDDIADLMAELEGKLQELSGEK